MAVRKPDEDKRRCRAGAALLELRSKAGAARACGSMAAAVEAPTGVAAADWPRQMRVRAPAWPIGGAVTPGRRDLIAVTRPAELAAGISAAQMASNFRPRHHQRSPAFCYLPPSQPPLESTVSSASLALTSLPAWPWQNAENTRATCSPSIYAVVQPSATVYLGSRCLFIWEPLIQTIFH